MKFLINGLMQEKPSMFIKCNEAEIFRIIPELSMSQNFNQNNIWHIYDVYEHILNVVDGVPNNLVLRIAALFHDVGKPYVYKEDENGIGHFYNHWIKSKEIFEKFAENYNLENSTKTLISNLILYHDINFDKASEETLNNLIRIFSKKEIVMLFELKKSDLLAQNPKFHYLLNEYEIQKNKVLVMK